MPEITNKLTATHIFFYGSLRTAFAHPVYKQVVKHLRFISSAQCQGILYDLGKYPGLCLASSSNQKVIGDLYQILSVADVLTILDEYEGCATHCRRPHEYRRSALTVSLPNDRQCRAWVYVYQGKSKAQQRIVSGDYVDYMQHKNSA